MEGLVPASWRDSVENLRQGVMSAFDRWLSRPKDRNRDMSTEAWPDFLQTAGWPAIDLDETNDEVVIAAELPGLDKKDFIVEVEPNRVVLRGEKRASRKGKKGAFRYSEAAYGSFVRAIPLPCAVVAPEADATYKHGVLKVRLPKTENAKARPVRVKVS